MPDSQPNPDILRTVLAYLSRQQPGATEAATDRNATSKILNSVMDGFRQVSQVMRRAAQAFTVARPVEAKPDQGKEPPPEAPDLYGASTRMVKSLGAFDPEVSRVAGKMNAFRDLAEAMRDLSETWKQTSKPKPGDPQAKGKGSSPLDSLQKVWDNFSVTRPRTPEEAQGEQEARDKSKPDLYGASTRMVQSLGAFDSEIAAVGRAMSQFREVAESWKNLKDTWNSIFKPAAPVSPTPQLTGPRSVPLLTGPRKQLMGPKATVPLLTGPRKTSAGKVPTTPRRKRSKTPRQTILIPSPRKRIGEDVFRTNPTMRDMPFTHTDAMEAFKDLMRKSLISGLLIESQREEEARRPQLLPPTPAMDRPPVAQESFGKTPTLTPQPPSIPLSGMESSIPVTAQAGPQMGDGILSGSDAMNLLREMLNELRAMRSSLEKLGQDSQDEIAENASPIHGGIPVAMERDVHREEPQNVASGSASSGVGDMAKQGAKLIAGEILKRVARAAVTRGLG